MSPGFSVSAALLAAVAGGVLATLYLWRVQRRRAETAAGLQALAGMRWRECARLVVEALQRRGFEPEPAGQTLEHPQQPELRLRRGDELWLLACKQGDAGYTVDRAQVRALLDAVRHHGAAGGVLATPGRIDADARAAADGLQLYAGPALWDLLSPQLPAVLREDLTADARTRIRRAIGLAWVAAAGLGAAVGFAPMLLRGSPDAAPLAPAPRATRPAAPIAAAPAPAAPAPAAPPAGIAGAADPDRERRERAEVIRAVAAVPGVGRALWSTSSTLLIEQVADDGRDRVPEICAILGRYDALRASRLQLQPPPGSGARVRFLQCRSY